MTVSIIKKYYDALGNGKLLAKKCDRCGQYTFPPTTACEHCGSFEQSEVELSGKGTLHFLTNSMAPPPNGRFDEMAPFGYGRITLEEDIPLLAIVNNVNLDPESLKDFFEKGPVQIEADIITVKGLPVLAFKLA